MVGFFFIETNQNEPSIFYLLDPNTPTSMYEPMCSMYTGPSWMCLCFILKLEIRLDAVIVAPCFGFNQTVPRKQFSTSVWNDETFFFSTHFCSQKKKQSAKYRFVFIRTFALNLIPTSVSQHTHILNMLTNNWENFQAKKSKLWL